MGHVALRGVLLIGLRSAFISSVRFGSVGLDLDIQGK